MSDRTDRNLFIRVSKVNLSLQQVRILSRSDKQAENTDKISCAAVSKVRISPDRFFVKLIITREHQAGIILYGIEPKPVKEYGNYGQKFIYAPR